MTTDPLASDDETPRRGHLLPELPTTESGYWRWLLENELIVDVLLDDDDRVVFLRQIERDAEREQSAPIALGEHHHETVQDRPQVVPGPSDTGGETP